MHTADVFKGTMKINENLQKNKIMTKHTALERPSDSLLGSEKFQSCALSSERLLNMCVCVRVSKATGWRHRKTTGVDH